MRERTNSRTFVLFFSRFGSRERLSNASIFESEWRKEIHVRCSFAFCGTICMHIWRSFPLSSLTAFDALRTLTDKRYLLPLFFSPRKVTLFAGLSGEYCPAWLREKEEERETKRSGPHLAVCLIMQPYTFRSLARGNAHIHCL